MSAPVVEDFIEHFASITDEQERSRLLSRVKLQAVKEAPEEAFKPIGRSAAELIAEVPREPDWLVPNLIALGWTVKIAAREKTGKGTFINYLLGCLERGEPTLFGPATEPVSAVVYSEEPQDSLREKIDNFDLERAWIVYGWEYAALPTWAEKVNRLVRTATELGHGIVFVDNISRAAGIEDEAGVELARSVEVLSDAAKAAGLTVIVDHHHKKGAGKLADKSRGGTATAGATENNIEIEHVGDWLSRVRKLSSLGRISSTRWEQTIALSEDGRSYESVAGKTQPQTAGDRQRLRALHDAGDAGFTAPNFAGAIEASDDTARRVLEEFVSKGWATKSDGKPAIYRSTGEGLADGPLDI